MRVIVTRCTTLIGEKAAHVFFNFETRADTDVHMYTHTHERTDAGSVGENIVYVSGANNKVIKDDDWGVVNWSLERRTRRRRYVPYARPRFTVVTRCPLLQKLRK